MTETTKRKEDQFSEKEQEICDECLECGKCMVGPWVTSHPYAVGSATRYTLPDAQTGFAIAFLFLWV